MHLVIYTNILSPYRKHLYDSLYEECKKTGNDFHVILMAETEPNRTWKYDEYKTDYTVLLKDLTLDGNGACIHINFGLKKLLKRLSPDVLICSGNYLCPGVWEAARLSRRLGYNCLYWSESHLNEERHYNSFKLKLREALRKGIYKKFCGFWFAGKKSKEFIEKYASENAHYHFLPNLVNEKYFKVSVSPQEKNELRLKYNIHENHRVLFSPARLHPAKGLCEFAELLSKTENKKNITYLIAGSGELENDIKKTAEKYGLDIRLLGEKKQEEIIELYKLCDIFALPSKSDPNPLSCIEASWAGLPLLISDHCGNFPEIIDQGQNGFVFSYGDEEKAIEYINKIISADREWLAKAGEKSIAIAKKTYSTSSTVKRIVNEMSSLNK